MPCATIHLTLANAVLADWSASDRSVPFDARRPELRDAFLHGALAPDMGYVPGVDRFISDLAHYIRPAALARALLARCEDPLDTAFAWGWVTHLLGDQELHPVVGRAVGERLFGDRDRRIDAAVDVAEHVSVEVGLDIVFLLRDPSVSRPPAEPHFDERRITLLGSALRETYDHDWSDAELLGSHRRAVGLTRWWPRALRVLGARRGWPPSAPGGGLLRTAVTGAVGLVGLVAARGEAARGLFAAERPAPWVVEEFEEVLDRFPRRFSEIARAGPEAIPDRNLETGGPAGEGKGHLASDAVAALLAAGR